MTDTTPTASSPENSSPLILKTDSLGRVRAPAHRREALLDEFEQSGLSGKKFAALSGIKCQTFACWVQGRQRKRQGRQPPQAKPAKTQMVSWLEAVIQEAGDQAPLSRGSLTVHLPGGARVELASTRDIPLAAALVRALEKPC